MAKDNKSQMITIDGIEYDTAEFTEEQINTNEPLFGFGS